MREWVNACVGKYDKIIYRCFTGRNYTLHNYTGTGPQQGWRRDTCQGEGKNMKKEFLIWIMAPLLFIGLFSACPWGSSSSDGSEDAIVVNSLQDLSDPPIGTVTIRDAIERINPGGTITFDPSLNGGTIDLSIVGEEHSTLKGEVFAPGFQGYQERDYGASALYAAKDLTMDASDLPDGITLNWTGGEADPARVLAVYGDLTMDNVNISSGVASAVFLTACYPLGMCFDQTFTLARGGGVATWGVARLTNCEISGNMLKGETLHWRDQGAFGGGIYGDVLILEDCVISGNSVKGYGAGGGGVFSTGGWDSTQNSSVTRCAVTGNSIAGQHTYGGGIYTDGGGRTNTEPITITSSTIARNVVMHHPEIPAPDASTERYYRGGGIYMSNGYLWIDGCTIVENQVTGYAATFHGEPNMSGGGVAATVGDAHVVEDMQIRQSIIAGNTVDGEPGDLFSGSVVDFYSWGYNLIGDLNFEFIHVPVPWWSVYMSRKHYPGEGDLDGVDVEDVLSLAEAELHPTIVSVGVAMGDSTVLYYPPAGEALDTIPGTGYSVPYVKAGWPLNEPAGFLDDVLVEINNRYGMNYSSYFGTDLATITFYGPANTWPDPDDHPENQPWILFWRDLDTAMAASPWPTMGPEKLADDFWGTPFKSGNGPNINNFNRIVTLTATDQLGNSRPTGASGDIGAIEIP
jgi:hypothetical protein